MAFCFQNRWWVRNRLAGWLEKIMFDIYDSMGGMLFRRQATKGLIKNALPPLKQEMPRHMRAIWVL
ncbi:hypothetical protein BX666DRAFT_1904002 [Dichotomocladium elegans]|nr:hypothetical protein BX666DRAFT_1904002 [Dichotomocladium elegans]